jgi:hypothetical protein
MIAPPEHPVQQSSRTTTLFLASLGSGLGDLASTSRGLLNRLDNTNGDGLTHVTDSETAERRVVSERLDAHRLGGDELDDSGIAGLDELRVVLNRLAGTAVDLLEHLGELASNVGSVAVQDRSVASTDLAGVVEDDNLGGKGSSTCRRVVLGITSHVAATDFLDRDVLHVEANVVARHTLDELLVVHLDGLDFSGDHGGSECDDHTGLEDTSLDTADGNSSNTADLVHVLQGKTEGLVGRTLGGLDGVNSLEEGLPAGLGATLGDWVLLPALVPWAILGGLQHVVAVESGDGNERSQKKQPGDADTANHTVWHLSKENLCLHFHCAREVSTSNTCTSVTLLGPCSKTGQ